MAGTIKLLQRPSRWTAEHLEIARVKVTEDVHPSTIFGAHAPSDGDAGLFTNLSSVELQDNMCRT